jgi:hypothetical protein
VAAASYSLAELDRIQDRWQLRFPPDLIALLRQQRNPIEGSASFDWLLGDEADIQRRLDWPFEGFLFDVERNGLWWPTWGPRPAEAAQRRDALRAVFATVPKLIPLFGHRYLPADPCEPGNPVFSVYQSDVIYYGADLQDWMQRERTGWDTVPWPPVKKIRFWSEAEERNG